jgi:hypothetical protein
MKSLPQLINQPTNQSIDRSEILLLIAEVTVTRRLITLAGSMPTRPQARAATPAQPCEMAMIPMESGPGFIPGIWSHSTAVPVALDRNSVNVSSAIDISLRNNE